MITRKAILAAFEIITNDPKTKTVTYFIRPNADLFRTIERVRVTRIFRGNGVNRRQDFRVQFGRCNYAEREHLRKFARRREKLPTTWIVPFPKARKK